MVVLVKPAANQQAAYLTTPNSRPVGCVSFSPNGKFLAAGEVGHQPSVIVWELATQKVVAELRGGHKAEVASLCWAQSGKHLASVGVEGDGTLCVWSWRTSALVASKTLSSRVCSVTSLADGSFVTSGHRHLKFWNLRKPSSGSKVTATQLDGRSAVLGVERDSTYTSVCGGRSQADKADTYGVSARGLLCLFNAEHTIERYVNVKPGGGEQGRAYGVATCSRCVAVGCSDGVVRLFAPKTLQYIATLPKPAACSRQNDSTVDQDLSVSYDEATHAEVFPDAVCISVSEDGNKLSVIYSDHSLYVWDIADTSNIGKYRSYLSHAGCVWDVACMPAAAGTMPAGTFVTSSADSTVRFWNIDTAGKRPKQKQLKAAGDGKKQAAAVGTEIVSRSAYSRDTVSMIYCGGTSTAAFKSWKATDPESTLANQPQPDVEIRCLSISPDGGHLASGDRMGNIRVHELESNQLYAFHEAHDGEVTALAFSAELQRPNAAPRVLLASASKDSLVHVFDSTSDYELAQTSSDHTGAVTGLCFASDEDTAADPAASCRLMTCSADKTVAFRTVTSNKGGLGISKTLQSSSPGGRLHSLAATHDGKYAVAAGGDQTIKIWEASSGVLKRTIKTDGKAEPIKVVIDPSDTLMAVCSSDRGIRLYELKTGELQYKVRGHSEVVTGMTFSADGSELITVSADSCIFVWKIGADLQRVIRHKLLTKRAAQERRSRSSPAAAQDEGPVRDSARPRDVPLLPLGDALASLSGGGGRPAAAGAINLSNTLTPAWAKDASIEVAHHIVKSSATSSASVPSSARSESSTNASEASSSCWAEAEPTFELYADPSGPSTPSSPAPSNWDDVSRSQDHSSPIAARKAFPGTPPQNIASTCSTEKAAAAAVYAGDGPSILMDDMVVNDMTDDEDDNDEGVIYFAGGGGKDKEKFEVTQSIQGSLSKRTGPASPELEEEQPLANSSTKLAVVAAGGCSGSDSEAEYALPVWLSADVPSGERWAAAANASMRKSFSSKYRETQQQQLQKSGSGAQAQLKIGSGPPASPARLTLKQEREALKKAEAEAGRSSSMSLRGSNGSAQLSARGVGMSLLRASDGGGSVKKSGGNGDALQKAKEAMVAKMLKKQATEKAAAETEKKEKKEKEELADAAAAAAAATKAAAEAAAVVAQAEAEAEAEEKVRVAAAAVEAEGAAVVAADAKAKVDEAAAAEAAAALKAGQGDAAVAVAAALEAAAAEESARAAVIAAAALAVDIAEKKAVEEAVLQLVEEIIAYVDDQTAAVAAVAVDQEEKQEEPSASAVFGSSKTESMVFGPDSSRIRIRSSSSSSSSSSVLKMSMPAMPSLSSDEDHEEDQEDAAATAATAATAVEMPAGPDADATNANAAAETTSKETAAELQPEVEVVAAVADADDVADGSAVDEKRDDEAAARLKMEKVMARMAADFEEELAAVTAKSAAETLAIAGQLLAEKEAHAKAISAAMDAEAEVKRTRKEMGEMTAEVEAMKREAEEKDAAAAEVNAMHSTMKSEAADAASKAAEALAGVIAWSSSPRRADSAPLPTRV